MNPTSPDAGDRRASRRRYPARAERNALCDLLAEVGPDQPTLCAGWTARDLAAHLIVRERRPDAAIGAILPPLRSRTEAIRAKTARDHSFEQLIALVRRPRALSLAGLGVIDRAANTSEFFIHHEDVRRGAPGWEPRQLDPALAAALLGQMRLTARLRLRRFPVAVAIVATGHEEPIRIGAQPAAGGGEDLAGGGSGDRGAAGSGGVDSIRLTGDVGELTLFLSGRQDAARVEMTGPAEMIARLRAARLGF